MTFHRAASVIVGDYHIDLARIAHGPRADTGATVHAGQPAGGRVPGATVAPVVLDPALPTREITRNVEDQHIR